jgi:membrane protease YdiL (CAAX protease family)
MIVRQRFADLYPFIDLARLGRTGFWVTVRSLVRLGLYVLVAIILILLVLVPLSFVNPTIFDTINRIQTGDAGLGWELGFIALTTVLMLWTLRDIAVKTLRRPFMSLIAAAPRIELRRVLAGLCAWILSAALIIPLGWAASLLLDSGRSQLPVFQLPGLDVVEAIALGVLIVPFQAASEELLFRGWLTQTLGQAIRNPILLVLAIALLFALSHGFSAGPLALPYFMLGSIGLSAISLADQRLELSIGVHTAQNLFVLLIQTPMLDPIHRPTLFGATSVQIGLLELLLIALQFGLIYATTRATPFRRCFGIA